MASPDVRVNAWCINLTCALEWLYVCVCLTFCHWLQAGCDWNNYSGVTYLLYLNSEVFSEMFDTLTSAWRRTQIWMALLKYLIWYWFKWSTEKNSFVLFSFMFCVLGWSFLISTRHRHCRAVQGEVQHCWVKSMGGRAKTTLILFIIYESRTLGKCLTTQGFWGLKFLARFKFLKIPSLLFTLEGYAETSIYWLDVILWSTALVSKTDTCQNWGKTCVLCYSQWCCSVHQHSRQHTAWGLKWFQSSEWMERKKKLVLKNITTTALASFRSIYRFCR